MTSEITRKINRDTGVSLQRIDATIQLVQDGATILSLHAIGKTRPAIWTRPVCAKLARAIWDTESSSNAALKSSRRSRPSTA